MKANSREIKQTIVTFEMTLDEAIDIGDFLGVQDLSQNPSVKNFYNEIDKITNTV